MSEMGLEMDQEVTDAFQRLYDKIDDKVDSLPCGDRGERLAGIEQHLANGNKQSETEYKRRSLEVNILRVVVAVLSLGIIFLAFVGSFLEILK